MPSKNKRQLKAAENLDKARKVKVRRVEGDTAERVITIEELGETSGLAGVLTLSDDVLDTEDEDEDPSFDLDSSLKEDDDHIMESFCEDWVTHLTRDNRVSLGLFLSFQLSKLLKYGETEAAELAGMMVGKSDRTVREWRTSFFENGGEIPEGKQGTYQRNGKLWSNEALNDKAAKFVRENADVKGRPNLTASSFCQWVNEDLLPNSTLEPGYPRNISVQTARRWLPELGFEVVKKKKGTYVDGHEREDVVAYRKTFLSRMVLLGFLNAANSPTDEAKQALPADIQSPSEETIEKTVIFFHDESTFQSNDDQPTLWAKKGTNVIRPKTKGSGIMISDFIEGKNGFLGLNDVEYEEAKKKDPGMKKYARRWLEYGEAKEGYWTSDKFMDQMKDACKIAEFKYPRDQGWKLVWIFDHSSCHAAMPDDALDVNKMNVNPGGKQRIMRDGWWGDKPQTMNFVLGIPKGLRQVLEERGIDTRSKNADAMRKILATHPDFKSEKSSIERFLMEERRHVCHMLPKFHCELNPIERVWAQAKRYTRAYCKYSIVGLRKNINPALDTIPLESIQKHFRKVRHYMFAYLEGIPGGSDLEKLVKQYKIAVKSHRRISELQ